MRPNWCWLNALGTDWCWLDPLRADGCRLDALDVTGMRRIYSHQLHGVEVDSGGHSDAGLSRDGGVGRLG